MRARGGFAASFAAIVVCAASSGAGAAATLFKCIEGGRTVYQQQACSVSSQPEPAASAPLVARAGAEAASAARKPVRPASPASAGRATSR